MEPIFFTPRLRLSLLTQVDTGSPELSWCHELRSDEKATLWSIYGRSKSVEDTQKVMKNALPTDEPEEEKSYRVVYAVHEFLDSVEGGATKSEEKPTRFIGLVTLKSLDHSTLALPEHLIAPTSGASTMILELGYQFLPSAWGRGYATEAVGAVFESCRRARAFWSPFSKVWIQAIVNDGNPPSQRVMNKTGMTKRGVHEMTTKPMWLGGEWRERHVLHIFGMYLIE